MPTVTLDPAFLLEKGKRISTTLTSSEFVYKNLEADLIIDGDLDFSGAQNNALFHAKRIVVTPRATLTMENVTLRAEEDVIVHGAINANKNIEIDSPMLRMLGGAHNYRWFGLRKQLTSYNGDATQTVNERVVIAHNLSL